ncbi:MAG TPA: hypothetical protein PK129_07695 [Cellvibrionaceae bacterium]|nr:hypothetical protein [Cellvibrionaceae bacterium]
MSDNQLCNPEFIFHFLYETDPPADHLKPHSLAHAEAVCFEIKGVIHTHLNVFGLDDFSQIAIEVTELIKIGSQKLEWLHGNAFAQGVVDETPRYYNDFNILKNLFENHPMEMPGHRRTKFEPVVHYAFLSIRELYLAHSTAQGITNYEMGFDLIVSQTLQHTLAACESYEFIEIGLKRQKRQRIGEFSRYSLVSDDFKNMAKEIWDQELECGAKITQISNMIQKVFRRLERRYEPSDERLIKLSSVKQDTARRWISIHYPPNRNPQ